MAERVHPAIDAKEFGEMLGICARLAGEHIKNHPRCIVVGKGRIRPRYRLPYDDAVAIATGRQELPELPQPVREPKETVKRPKPPRRRKTEERAANGCLYAARRK
ncbi:MAG: hypothetical protein PUD63_12315 [Clostridia bacterium]|nr:hypothetical protein [Clostridia bacterium]